MHQGQWLEGIERKARVLTPSGRSNVSLSLLVEMARRESGGCINAMLCRRASSIYICLLDARRMMRTTSWTKVVGAISGYFLALRSSLRETMSLNK